MERCHGGDSVGWGWSVSHRSPLLVELVGALGEGWCAFVATAERGETLSAPGVSAGLSGEPSRDLNWIVAYGPDGVAEGVSRAVRRLRERGLPGVVYAASPAAGEVAGVAGELDLKAAGSLPVMCVRGGDVVRAEVGYEVRRVTDVEGVLSAGDVLGDAFDLPVDWCQRLLGVGFPTQLRRRPLPQPAVTAVRWPWPASRRSGPSPASTRWGRAMRIAAAAPARRRCRRRSTTT